MIPPIKYNGGKRDFVPLIEKFMPENISGRWIEPFVGGGAFTFALEGKPEVKIINDLDIELIRFYRAIQMPDWESAGNHFISIWENLHLFAHEITTDCKYEHRGDIFTILVDNEKWFREIIKGTFGHKMWNFILKDISRKVLLMEKQVEKGKHTIEGAEKYFRSNMEKVIVSSLYYVLRDNHYPKNEARWGMSYWIIRELAYGGLVRYNKEGKYNVPMGTSYIGKNLRGKFKLTMQAGKYLKDIQVYNLGYDEFFRRINPTSGDWLFLDPPYLSPFRNYGNNDFTARQHNTLATWMKIVDKNGANFLMIIQEHPSLWKWYSPRFTIETMNSRYKRNIKNRFTDDVSYMFIHNMGDEIFVK